MSPSYIIDGYNLIHALGMIQKNEPAGGLEDSRRRLLSFLAGVFAGQTSRVIVVFDAQDAPPGATRQLHFQGLKVHFAPKHLTADDWIEKLIADEKQPRGLVVISNDHRLQIAARQRGARAWPHDALLDFAESRNAPPIASAAGPEGDGRAPADMSPDEKKRWIDEFQSLESDPELKEFFEMDRFDDQEPRMQ